MPWRYVLLSRALWAIAGFFMAAPIVWTERARQRFAPVQLDLLSIYLIFGLVLASAVPLTVLVVNLGQETIAQWLGLLYSHHLDIFGAILVGAALAVGSAGSR